MLPLFYPAILITAMFFLSGIEKIMFFPRSTGKFAKKMGVRIIIAQLIISAVIALEIAAPTAIIAYMFTGLASLSIFFKFAVLALIAFTILATLLYHNPLKGREKYYAFMSNVCAVGGLLALYLCPLH
jgi:uncharacterized membrane protein YphA (DoxX/SURF4 family)